MADVNINKFRASVVREGSKPASPGFIVSEGQSPTDPAGSGQNHLPVTIATTATGLSITESQVLGGAGTVGQYIRGDGSLADFPESSGGGSSISYYLNGSVSQGTIGGVAYKELNKVPVLGAGTDFTINADGYIASFLTDAGDPNLLEIPGGNWNFETFFSANSGGGSPTFYVELYKYNGTTFTLLASNSTFPELIAFGTNVTAYFSTLAVPTTTLALTDRLAIRYYVIHSGRTITLHTEDNHLCQIITTFTTGLTALNGLTAQIQNFAVGTSGTDFAIASATATHTFNLPTASATNRGALSSADWTTFNNKTSNLGTVTSVGLSSATSGVTIGSSPVTTSGTITLAIATASGSQNGLLSSTDWTTFNGKQNALTNPVTGTGASGQVAYFTGTTAISSESNLFWDSTNDRLGIGTNGPAAELQVSKTSDVTIAMSNSSSVTSGNRGSLAWYNSSVSTVANIRAVAVTDNVGTELQFYTRPAAGSLTQVITVNSLGNLGIGVPNPQTQLHLNGIITFTEAGSNTVRLNQILSAHSDGSSPNNNLRFIVSNGLGVSEERMRINGSGNLLVGTLSDNGAMLQVSGTANISSTLTAANSEFLNGGQEGSLGSVVRISTTNTNANSRNWAIVNTWDNYGDLTFRVSNSQGGNALSAGATTMVILSNGNVGIGTSSPSAKFHVDGYTSGLPPTSGSAQRGGYRIANASNIAFDFGTVASGQAWIQVSDVNNYASNFALLLNPNGGNVLIGTTTDGGDKLQVNGTIFQSNYTYHGNNATGNLNGASIINTSITLSATNLITYEVYTLGNENGRNQAVRVYFVYYNTAFGWSTRLVSTTIETLGNDYGVVTLLVSAGGVLQVQAGNLLSTGNYRVVVMKQFKN